MPTGKVKWYDPDKGFGFLTSDEGGDVHVRADALPEGAESLKSGTRVEFGIAQGRRGDQALQVRVIEPRTTAGRTAAPAKARKKPEEMETIVEDVIRLLEGIEEGYRHGRYPDRKTARPVAQLLRGLAAELDA